MYVKKTEKQIKEVEVITESYSLCDRCNEKIQTGSYDAFEFELEYKTGDSYPEGGSGEKKEMELCDKCADDCIQLLKDNGYRINESEWDW
tara:strand:+ start:458 stop:727 length:270 start_codon:yes stop_codon:yes gene_type:complete